MTHTGCRGTEGRRLWGKGSVQNEGVGGAIDGRDEHGSHGRRGHPGARHRGPRGREGAACREAPRVDGEHGRTCTSTDVAVGTRDTRVCTRTHASRTEAPRHTGPHGRTSPSACHTAPRARAPGGSAEREEQPGEGRGQRAQGAQRGGRSRADGPAACGGSEAAPRERCHRVAAHGITEGTASHAEPTARVTKGGTFTRPQSASSRKRPLTFEGDGQGRRSRCRAPAGTGSMMGALLGQCWGKAQPPAVQQDAGGGAISSATRLPTRHSRECAPEVPSGTLLRAPATS